MREENGGDGTALICPTAQMARDIGREPASVDEARALLSLDKPW